MIYMPFNNHWDLIRRSFLMQIYVSVQLPCKLLYQIIFLASCYSKSSCWQIVVTDHPFCKLLRQITCFSHQIIFHANCCTRSTNIRIIVTNHFFEIVYQTIFQEIVASEHDFCKLLLHTSSCEYHYHCFYA